jgi:hypothetical protein
LAPCLPAALPAGLPACLPFFPEVCATLIAHFLDSNFRQPSAISQNYSGSVKSMNYEFLRKSYDINRFSANYFLNLQIQYHPHYNF